MKILIVDDDRTNLLVMAALLTTNGYTVAQAENGAAALEMLRR